MLLPVRKNTVPLRRKSQTRHYRRDRTGLRGSALKISTESSCHTAKTPYWKGAIQKKRSKLRRIQEPSSVIAAMNNRPIRKIILAVVAASALSVAPWAALAGNNNPLDFKNGPYASERGVYNVPKRGMSPVVREEASGNSSAIFITSAEFFYSLDIYREAAGLPPMEEDASLAYAAWLIAAEMSHQDYPYLPLPDGKDLRWALKKAKYKGPVAAVQAYYGNGTFEDGRGTPMLIQRNKPVPTILASVQTQPYVAYGAACEVISTYASYGKQDTFYAARRLTDGFAQVYLVSSTPPAKRGRFLFDQGDLGKGYSERRLGRDITIDLKRGKRLRGIAVVGEKSAIRGRVKARLQKPKILSIIPKDGGPTQYILTGSDPTKNGLPPGVRLNSRTGELLGRPQKKGIFYAEISGSYRPPKDSANDLNPKAWRGRKKTWYKFDVR